MSSAVNKKRKSGLEAHLTWFTECSKGGQNPTQGPTAIDLGVPTTFSSVGLIWEAAYATDYLI